MKSQKSSPGTKSIGVFDSGLGGLTIVKKLRQILPTESIVYFGDIARLPYGIKSQKQIVEFSIQNAEFLLTQNVKTIMVACNSSSSAAYSILKSRFKLPIIDVIEPAAREAVSTTKNKRIGVIATQATIDTQAYEKTLTSLDPQLEVYSRACPMFVPMVEEGWLDGKITDQIVALYLEPIKRKKIDVLMLGCTHYPLLKKSIQKYVGPKVKLIDSADASVKSLRESLHLHDSQSSNKSKGKLQIFVSDKPRNFIRVGEQFLGEKLEHVSIVRQST